MPTDTLKLLGADQLRNQLIEQDGQLELQLETIENHIYSLLRKSESNDPYFNRALDKIRSSSNNFNKLLVDLLPLLVFQIALRNMILF